MFSNSFWSNFSNTPEEDDSTHPFGGCERLLGQYRIVGTELQRLDVAREGYSTKPPYEAVEIFRQSLVFVPIEALCSYRDDLLNPEISSSRLFIGQDAFGWKIPSLASVGVLGAIALGLYAASSGANFLLSLAITFIISSPFVAILHHLPREGSLRRLRFAKWLNDEISNRRGDREGRGSGIRRRNTGLLSPFWVPDGQSSLEGTASRVRFH